MESVALSSRACGALPCSASWRVRSKVFCASTTFASALSCAALRAAMTSARVPARMFASCASATALAAADWACLAIVSGLSILTSTAPAATFWPRTTGLSATRPPTRAAVARLAPGGDVEPRRIALALHQQRRGPRQVPDRQCADHGDDHCDDDRRNSTGAGRPLLRRLLVLRQRRGGLRRNVRRRDIHADPP